LLPSRHDPRNAICAELSVWLLRIELVFLAFLIFWPVTNDGSSSEGAQRLFWMLGFLVPTALTMIGLRGWSSGDRRARYGAWLALLNGLFLLFIVLAFADNVRAGMIEF
jgi:hypothetical protein